MRVRTNSIRSKLFVNDLAIAAAFLLTCQVIATGEGYLAAAAAALCAIWTFPAGPGTKFALGRVTIEDRRK